MSSSVTVWVNAMIATLIVSLIPNLLLVLLPESMLQDGKKDRKIKRSTNLGKMLLMFAVAGLLGDVFLHTLPHMLAPNHHNHAHDHDGVEKVLMKPQSGHNNVKSEDTCHIDSDHHSCKLEDTQHNHHDHSDHYRNELEGDGQHNDARVEEQQHHHDRHEVYNHSHSGQKPLFEKEVWAPLLLLTGFLSFFLAEKAANSFLSTKHDHDHRHHDHTDLKAAGWLNLVADSLHNFTDGITIGAAFASGRGLGLAAFLSVVIHEVPHEISDFIILIRSGMTKWQAIGAQFITAFAAFWGTALGLYLSENNETVQTVLLAITGGGFVYIAAVNVMPQVIAPEESKNESLGLLQVLGEVFCFALGVGLMIAVARLEEHNH